MILSLFYSLCTCICVYLVLFLECIPKLLLLLIVLFCLIIFVWFLCAFIYSLSFISSSSSSCFAFFILWPILTLSMVAFSLLFLFGVRFLSVVIALIASRFHWKSYLFFTFFSPKGLIPIAALFLFFPLPFSLSGNLIVTTITLSILIHSPCALFVTHLYSRAMKKGGDLPEHLPSISLPSCILFFSSRKWGVCHNHSLNILDRD